MRDEADEVDEKLGEKNGKENKRDLRLYRGFLHAYSRAWRASGVASDSVCSCRLYQLLIICK